MFATYCDCMNIKIYLFLAIFLAVIVPTKAQSFDVSGIVIDADEETVAFANILVLNPQDSTVVTGTSSDDKGLFKIDKLRTTFKTPIYEDRIFLIKRLWLV